MSRGARERVYLVPEPLDPYPARLIDHVFARYGLRAVCLHASEKNAHYHRDEFPPAFGRGVAAHVFGPPSRDGARALRSRYDIAGIAPVHERAVSSAAAWIDLLDLGWNEARVLGRFRNKYALKEHVRAVRPDLRMNAIRRVASAEDVFAAPLPDRFVLKPNDGFGSRDVGFFSSRTPPGVIAAFLARAPGQAFLLEERISGVEYCVNGQIDGEGTVTVTHVLCSMRAPANGVANICRGLRHEARTSPRFAPLVDYAVAVMKATGLRRSPFHLELMLDPDLGPCLLEVGARFGGNEIPLAADDVHASRLRSFELAAHHYLFDGPTPITLDWDHHDRVDYMILHGIAAAPARVYSLAGIDAVEALREFRRWDRRPRIGMQVERTIDLLTMPYSLHLMSDGAGTLDALADEVRDRIRWNGRTPAATRAVITLAGLAHRSYIRGTWMIKERLPPAIRRAIEAPLPS